MSSKDKLITRFLSIPKDFTYKGYAGTVEYSEEDECLYGKVLGMDGNQITYEGSSIDELKSDFEGAVDFYIECCHERGIKKLKDNEKDRKNSPIPR